MASKARKAFDENAKDISGLLQLHTDAGGTQQGRRYGLEVLNKSAIVLITSHWEAYCEDIAAEGLAHLIEHTESANDLPSKLKAQIAIELKADLNPLSIWTISDDGWRTVIKSRLAAMKVERDLQLNTPKTDQINALFKNALGVVSMSSGWKWQGMSVESAKKKLDKFVSLRGAIAHRGAASESVTRVQVQDYFGFVQLLASKTGKTVNTYVKAITDKPLWS
jgi:hypothetical protein